MDTWENNRPNEKVPWDDVRTLLERAFGFYEFVNDIAVPPPSLHPSDQGPILQPFKTGTSCNYNLTTGSSRAIGQCHTSF